MNEDQIVDGIERVAPLAAGGGGAFEQRNILHRQAQQLATLTRNCSSSLSKASAFGETDSENPERRVSFPGIAHEDGRAKIFGQATAAHRDRRRVPKTSGRFVLQNPSDPRFLAETAAYSCRYRSLKPTAARKSKLVEFSGVAQDENKSVDWRPGFRPAGVRMPSSALSTLKDCVAWAVMRASRRSFSLRSSFAAAAGLQDEHDHRHAHGDSEQALEGDAE